MIINKIFFFNIDVINKRSNQCEALCKNKQNHKKKNNNKIKNQTNNFKKQETKKAEKGEMYYF